MELEFFSTNFCKIFKYQIRENLYSESRVITCELTVVQGGGRAGGLAGGQTNIFPPP